MLSQQLLSTLLILNEGSVLAIPQPRRRRTKVVRHTESSSMEARGREKRVDNKFSMLHVLLPLAMVYFCTTPEQGKLQNCTNSRERRKKV